MQPPANSGSHYSNYKHTHSMILLAIAGPDYECLNAATGAHGRIADGAVWNKCHLAHDIENNNLCLTDPKCLPSGAVKIPHVYVGDDDSTLQEFMARPFPQAGLIDESRV